MDVLTLVVTTMNDAPVAAIPAAAAAALVAVVLSDTAKAAIEAEAVALGATTDVSAAVIGGTAVATILNEFAAMVDAEFSIDVVAENVVIAAVAIPRPVAAVRTPADNAVNARAAAPPAAANPVVAAAAPATAAAYGAIAAAAGATPAANTAILAATLTDDLAIDFSPDAAVFALVLIVLTPAATRGTSADNGSIPASAATAPAANASNPAAATVAPAPAVAHPTANTVIAAPS